jgi:hypothetical protein
MSQVAIICYLAFVLTGCSWIMGESFADQQLRNPHTGKRVVCQGHSGRGEMTDAERSTMRARIASYEAKGFALD